MKLFWNLSRFKWRALGLLLDGIYFQRMFIVIRRNSLFRQPGTAFRADRKRNGKRRRAGATPANATSGDLTAARFHVGDTVTVGFSGTVDTIPEHIQPIKEDGTITLSLHRTRYGRLAGRQANCKTRFTISTCPSIMSG